MSAMDNRMSDLHSDGMFAREYNSKGSIQQYCRDEIKRTAISMAKVSLKAPRTYLCAVKESREAFNLRLTIQIQYFMVSVGIREKFFFIPRHTAAPL